MFALIGDIRLQFLNHSPCLSFSQLSTKNISLESAYTLSLSKKTCSKHFRRLWERVQPNNVLKKFSERLSVFTKKDDFPEWGVLQNLKFQKFRLIIKINKNARRSNIFFNCQSLVVQEIKHQTFQNISGCPTLYVNRWVFWTNLE